LTATLQIEPLPLAGACRIQPITFADERGQFVKTFHAGQLADAGLRFELREEFFSISRRGVLRGMHFQAPPYDHQKLVCCLHGRALDVLLDLRTASPTYGRHCAIELAAAAPQLVWVPRGVAHGFLSLEDNTSMLYKTDREHAPAQDAGILWNTFGCDWPRLADPPIVSPRDRQHPAFADFVSPF
jgi:dTDP-4-dehydrorhamnose 3,5-epimerase